MSINPQRLIGNWDNGWALDVHTIESVKDDVSGEFKNKYSDAGGFLHKIKYENRKDLIAGVGKVLSAFLLGEYPDMDFPKYFKVKYFDYILCVPPSNLNRSFQPVYEIAKEISKYTKIPILEKNVLEKIKQTKTLKDLPKEKRQDELKNVFKVKNPEILKNKNILIFDDIFGTGTTLTEIVKTLRFQSKISNIPVLTITKTRTSSGMVDDTDFDNNPNYKEVFEDLPF